MLLKCIVCVSTRISEGSMRYSHAQMVFTNVCRAGSTQETECERIVCEFNT